jgi:NADPH-dependent 2,4-dienoyl-CoA reductase/sulfur reductase-like enzyme
MRRRRALSTGLAAAVLGLAGVRLRAQPAVPRVLVVGGGYAGATAAKYLRHFSRGRVDVVLVEPEPAFVSCPMSNHVLGGTRSLADVTLPYDALARTRGVRLVRDRVARLDATRHEALLASGARIDYAKAVLAPGVDMMWSEIEGLRDANAAGRIVHAWHAGAETAILRRQLLAMPDGGTFAISIPEAPYRCPPAPYERACLVADWMREARPRAKVLVLDANEEPTSEATLFRQAWAERYRGRLEYRPQHKATGVDAASNTLRFEIQEDVRADVLNVLPPMRAGAVAVDAGLANANARWCLVDFLSFESTAARDVHVLGDSIQIAPAMPKSGHMANSQAKVAAAAIVAQLAGQPVDPAPMLTNTCYSFVDAERASHVVSVHGYLAAERTFRVVPGSSGSSAAPSAAEGLLAWGWARSIWADTLA